MKMAVNLKPKNSAHDKDTFTGVHDSPEKLVGDVIDSKDLVTYLSGDDAKSSNHVFQDPAVAQKYAQLYDEANYEGRRHFDPQFEWTSKEEEQTLRKTDLYVTAWAFVMFFALDIDRSNLANVISGTFFQDLHLNTADYNLGNTVYLVCFLIAEFPSQMMSKWVGANSWIPFQIIMWSIVASCQCFIQNRAGFLATRCLLGFLEGGFIPDMCLWMSYFFKTDELAVRLGYFYVANPLTNIVASLLSYGIFHLQGKTSWAGWRWVFLIEGLATLVIGIAAIFCMPPSAVETKTWYRPRGWYTDRQEKIMVNRILRDDPSKGDMRNRQALTFSQIYQSIKDFDLWPVYIDRLLICIIAGPISKYLPIFLKRAGFSTIHVNLLMIPPQVLTIITMLTQAYSHKHFHEYGFHLAVSSFWLIPLIGTMAFWSGFLVKRWSSYVLLVLALGAPPPWVLTISWCSANANSVRARTVAAALVNIADQAAGIISSNIFRPDDAPRYHRGFGQLFAIAIAATVAVLITKQYYIWRNREREREWNSLTRESQINYLEEAHGKGNKRLDFKFAT